MSDYPNPDDQHLPHEAWHVVQQKGRRRNVQFGAQFMTYVANEEEITKWKVVISQGNWSDEITSEDPEKTIHTPNLNGEFEVQAWGGGPGMEYGPLSNDPSKSGPNVECSANCAAMVILESIQDGKKGQYYTVSDAMC